MPGAQYPGDYLPGHTTFDLSLGKTFAEKYTVSLTALNVANRRVQLDNSLTFGGFHWNDPRQSTSSSATASTTSSEDSRDCVAPASGRTLWAGQTVMSQIS